MKLVPESMFGRLFLATCIPVIVMLGVSYALVARDRLLLTQRLSGSNNFVQSIVRSLEQLQPLPADSRAQAIEQLNRAPAAVGSDAMTRAADRMADVESMYLQPLRSRLPAGCRASAQRAGARVEGFVNLARPPSAPPPQPIRRAAPSEPAPLGGRGLYDVTVRCGSGEPVVFRLPAPPDRPQLDPRLAWQLLGLVIMLGATLYFATRKLTQPLVELQAAANAVGRATVPARFTETGAREIRESLRAFNLMQDRLRRYLDSRTRVLAAMSHDLRTPLTRLRLRAESAGDEATRERLIADIEEMDTLVHRSLGVFRGLNDEEAAVPTDVTALVTALVGEYADLGCRVSLVPAAAVTLPLRPLAVRRALRNLIDNACKYGSEALLSIVDGDRVCICVSDRGPGIPPDQMEVVFEPFRRLEDSRSRDTGGVGLGLTIARDIAELHGGSLTLRNRPQGGGLEAVLELPR